MKNQPMKIKFIQSSVFAWTVMYYVLNWRHPFKARRYFKVKYPMIVCERIPS